MQGYYKDDAAWDSIPSHMHGAVFRYVMNGIPPGGFLTALFSNDLMGTAGKADVDNLSALVCWIRFVYNDVPAACHGSPEAVAQWIERGGMKGKET